MNKHFFAEVVVQSCSKKKLFLEISQISQEINCFRASFFLISCRPQACNFIKKEALAQVFFVNFANFLRTPFII